MKKDGYLLGEIKRARFKFLLTLLLVTVLFVAFGVAKFPYIKTKIQGATVLDTDRFLKESTVVVIDELVELGRKETKTPSSACYKDNSYWQGDSYYYIAEIKGIKDTGKAFTQLITQGPDTGKETQTSKLYIADIGGREVALLASPYWDKTVRVKGYLTQMSKPVLSKLSETLAEGQSLEICEYMLDIRDIEMETENTDAIVFFLVLLALVFFWIKLVRNFTNPETTSTMRQLIKYGDITSVASEVDRQAVSDTAYTEGKKLIMEDYIAYRTSFKLKIERNHMAKH